MSRRPVAVGFVVVTVLGLVATPAVGAATGIDAPTATPSTVDTGATTTLALDVVVTGVDTGDGTAGGTVTFGLSSAVDLSAATVASASVTPTTNATGVSATVDDAGHAVTVRWDDAGGVADDRLTVSVTLDSVAVVRTGETTITASANADATGGVEVTSSAGTLTAVAAGSDRSVTATPATLYLGEESVDITGLDAANPAGASQQFYGVGGDAEGQVATADDTRQVDVTAPNSFVTGSYNLSSSDGDTDVVVREPRVTGVTLYAGATTTAADVTNQSVPTTTAAVTVETAFTFDDAEAVDVTVEDDDGLDVTEQLTASPTIAATGGTLTLDVSDLAVGEYTVTVEGADDLDDASMTKSFGVRDPEKSVTLSRTRVVRGDSTVASVAGAPGDVRYLRISGDALDGGLVNPATARDVFDRTSQVQSISADSDANSLYAVVVIDDDGISEARIRTDRLRTESVDVELAPAVAASAEDEVTLDVRERGVTVDSLPETAVGETVAVSGAAPQSERVKLYAAVDDRYVPLYEDAAAGTLAEPDVESDGTWRVDVDTAAVVNLTDAYRVVAVGDPGAARLGSTAALDSETLADLEPRGSTTLTTTEGALSLATSRTAIAATGDDEFTLSGVASGQPEDLRLYHVGPRGTTDARTVDTTDGRFETDVDGIDRQGTHTYLVVAAGRDGTYAYAPGGGPSVDSLLSGDETPAAARAELVDAYTGPGSDDRLARVTVTASDASVSLSTPTADAVAAEPLPVAGQSNSEDGAAVFVELTDESRSVAFAEASVTNGSWNATLDLADVSPGTYRLSVETADARTSRPLTVSTATAESSAAESTETETPQKTDVTGTPGEQTAEMTVTPGPSTEPSPESTTSTQFPGFGVVPALCALALAFVVSAARVGSGRGRR